MIEPGAWKSRLGGLNAAQRRAVEHDAGPLVVLAGPGTGKTRVIVHRIAHLIVAREVKPEQIVAVTYTTKAAAEMRERLGELLGSSLADRLHVRTFHGLGFRLIKRFSDMLGLPSEPDLIDSAQRRRLLRDLMIEHKLLAEFTGRGHEAAMEVVDQHLAAFWDHAITPVAARRFARGWADQIELMGPEEAEGQRAELRKFEQIVRLAEVFDAACRERGWLSYGDLIALPTELLRKNGTAAAIIRGEWRHFVVDEYQDVNASQIEFLRQLAPPASASAAVGGKAKGASGPDLCVVGDDDQAIYEFRGSDDQAFAKFSRIWPGHAKVELTENYRSNRGIIAAANDIMSRADRAHRYAPDKQVVPAGGAAGAGGASGRPEAPEDSVLAVKLANDRQDGDIIATMILTDRKKRPELQLRDFAVLARNRSDLDRVGAALAMEGITFVRRRESGTLADQGVQDVLAWIEVLVNPQATWALRRLLVRPPCGAPADMATDWERAYRRELSRHQAGAPEAADPGSFMQWMAGRLGSFGGAAELGAAILRLKDVHDSLRTDAATLRADEVIFRILTLADIAHADLISGRERTARVTGLLAVLRFARARQSRLDPPGDLAAFWSYYQDLSDEEQKFGDEGTRATIDGVGEGVSEGGGADAPEADDSGDGEVDAVQLVTAHSAKGLEFDTVFVTKVSPRGFPNVKEDVTDLPPGLIQRQGDDRSPKERRIAEERRLFYVACTRAQRKLVLLAKWNKGRSTTTHFFEELTRGRAGSDVALVLEMSDVLRAAQAAGVGAPARGEIDLAGDGFARLGALREALAKVRREARMAAAGALDQADRPDATPEDLVRIARALHEAAGRLAVASAVERRREAPAWAGSQGAPEAWSALAGRLVEISRKGGAAPGGFEFAPMTPPLKLSYTRISDYNRCPRCFYVKHVFDVPDADAEATGLGQAAHQALEQFYRRWTRADSDGLSLFKPGLEELLKLGREAFFRASAGAGEVDRAALERLLAQLRTTYELLHHEDAHVVETERKITFKYAHAGREHDFIAKLDRIDLAPGGRVRIIDYKTGEPAKRLLKPEKDDLQLGIYALAYQTTLPPGEPLSGTAEYWVLATGQRGVIALEELRLESIRNKINKAIDGMLAGEFSRKTGGDWGCGGLCAFLGP